MPEQDNNIAADALATQANQGEQLNGTVRKGRRLTVADILGRK